MAAQCDSVGGPSTRSHAKLVDSNPRRAPDPPFHSIGSWGSRIRTPIGWFISNGSEAFLGASACSPICRTPARMLKTVRGTIIFLLLCCRPRSTCHFFRGCRCSDLHRVGETLLVGLHIMFVFQRARRVDCRTDNRDVLDACCSLD